MYRDRCQLDLWWWSFCNIYEYQIITLYIWNWCNVICQSYQKEKGIWGTPDHTHKEHERAVCIPSIRHLEWFCLSGSVRVAGSRGGKKAASSDPNKQSASSRWTGLYSFHWPWAGSTSFLDGPGDRFSGMMWKVPEVALPSTTKKMSLVSCQVKK